MDFKQFEKEYAWFIEAMRNKKKVRFICRDGIHIDEVPTGFDISDYAGNLSFLNSKFSTLAVIPLSEKVVYIKEKKELMHILLDTGYLPDSNGNWKNHNSIKVPCWIYILDACGFPYNNLRHGKCLPEWLEEREV